MATPWLLPSPFFPVYHLLHPPFLLTFKFLHALEAIAAFSLDTTSKPHLPKEPLLDDRKCSVSPDTVSDESDSEPDELDVLHTKFVGEVDLSKCMFISSCGRSSFILP